MESARLPATPRTDPVAVAVVPADTSQAWSSPRRKARSTPRHLSERQRQRRVYHQHKPSPDASTDEAPADIVRTPRGRRKEPKSKIPILERSPLNLFSTAAETATSTATAIARPQTSDDNSALVCCYTFQNTSTMKQVAQLSQIDRAAGWVSFGQKWKTGTGRQYFADLMHLYSTTVT